MKTFQFSTRVYVKGTRITPFIMPKKGMYKCSWTEAGICNFEGIETGYTDLYALLDRDYFYMDQPLETNLIEYYDRLSETLVCIDSQSDFETALLHSSQTYSPFSLVIKVNAPRREEHWFNGEAVAFETSWRMSKPKFTCIREWLISLQENEQVCKDISESISYGEKAFLYSQFRRLDQAEGEDLKYSANQNKDPYQYSTNHRQLQPKMNQSNPPKNILSPIKPDDLELLEPSSPNQKMLHEKMMMDPTISMILFNEYIPLRLPKQQQAKEIKCESSEITAHMGGLFLGKMEDEPKAKVEKVSGASGGLFIRSEAAPVTGGLFIRSEDSSSTATEVEDWVIA